MPSLDELQRALAHVQSAPKDGATVEMLCMRPDFGQRNFVDKLELTTASGIPGERWTKHPWMTLEDGSPDPRIQVSILGRRVLDLVWRDRENTPHPGDTMIADMDMSEANLPAGQHLSIGSAVLEVSDLFNEACVKWKVRYGAYARAWITLPDNRPLRLRGILCRIVKDGIVRNGDVITKL